MLAKGREALATLIGGGSRGCKTKLVWTDWSHIMTNLVVTPTAEGAMGRLYLLQMDIKGPGTIERHGGYEDVYVKTPNAAIDRLIDQVSAFGLHGGLTNALEAKLRAAAANWQRGNRAAVAGQLGAFVHWSVRNAGRH